MERRRCLVDTIASEGPPSRIQAAINTRRRAAVGHSLPTMKWWPKGGRENADRTILPAQAPRDFVGPNLLAMIRSESSAGISH
jgi:hypothetical protein